ncbi:uncharacterized protein LOC126797064 [Argentina anserina]|uniref:uncharacterized protein LOC126797064 n=1 Tax=Argentina anserina TaxID=57926 RepID=UPI00217653CA|nr:uncharacterized protein LOC126797064 [Potentilla anserina]
MRATSEASEERSYPDSGEAESIQREILREHGERHIGVVERRNNMGLGSNSDLKPNQLYLLRLRPPISDPRRRPPFPCLRPPTISNGDDALLFSPASLRFPRVSEMFSGSQFDANSAFAGVGFMSSQATQYGGDSNSFASRESAISNLKELLADPVIGNNPILRMVARNVFMHEQDYNEAFKYTCRRQFGTVQRCDSSNIGGCHSTEASDFVLLGQLYN